MANQYIPSRTDDLIKYFTYLLDKWQKEFDEQSALREKAREEYEQSIWHRWFGCEFEKSSKGTLDWLSTRWDSLINASSNVDLCKLVLAKCVYQKKLNHPMITWDFDDFNEYRFYEWCDKNSIPY